MRRPARLVLLGHPVAHSLSPAMQNAALRAAGIPLTYTAWDVAPGDLAGALHRLTLDRGAGNVTTPHKEATVALCSRLSATARRVGAVNTVWTEADPADEDVERNRHRDREATRKAAKEVTRETGKRAALVGDNTDVVGFERAVIGLRGRTPADAVVCVLGAGGAAAAVLAAVADWPGCRARIWNRTATRAESLAARFPGVAVVASTPAAAVAGAMLVVNATTIGLTGHDHPIDPTLLPPGADVIDLVYRPGETAWARAARARGHRATDGLSMLVEQGALAFERWFGITPDHNAMWRAAQSSTSQSDHEAHP